VAAYLLMKPKQTANITKIWYKLETLQHNIQKLVNARRQDIRFIFVQSIIGQEVRDLVQICT
jgi:hypothetical protein